MPKFLVRGSYTPDGLKGILKEGGSDRKAAIEKLAESLGGKLEAPYFAFGEEDVYAIGDLSAADTRPIGSRTPATPSAPAASFTSRMQPRPFSGGSS